MSKKTRDILIVVFLGMFGVHKFINKEYKMGFLYLFTGGILGIGWIVDIVKTIFGYENSNSKSLMSSEEIRNIREGNLLNIERTNLNLANDEKCCYMDKGYTFKDKKITTGYTGNRSGVSIRLMKGLSYHTGGGRSTAIRETQRTIYNGILYITTKRIIFMSEKESFDKTFDKITAIQEANDGLIIQIGSSTYSIVIDTHSEFMQVFKLVKQLTN